MQNNYYAAADCGTNSFHMIIVRISDDDSLQIIARQKEIVRLGSSKEYTISPEAIEKSIQTLNRFKEETQIYNAPLAVVATSAVRKASNREEFLTRILESTGIKIRVLSGTEEAGLTFKGISQAVYYEHNVLCLDIGGGSTEFIIGKEREVLFTKSIELGAVRLSRRFFNDDYSYSEEQLDQCKKYAAFEINKIKQALRNYEFGKVIGASGTIISAASMVAGGASDLNNFHLKRNDLKVLTERIYQLKTVEQRKSIEGLESSRADIIPAGLIILSLIFEIFNIDEIIISLYGLREGIIIDSFISNKLTTE